MHQHTLARHHACPSFHPMTSHKGGITTMKTIETLPSLKRLCDFLASAVKHPRAAAPNHLADLNAAHCLIYLSSMTGAVTIPSWKTIYVFRQIRKHADIRLHRACATIGLFCAFKTAMSADGMVYLYSSTCLQDPHLGSECESDCEFDCEPLPNRIV